MALPTNLSYSDIGRPASLLSQSSGIYLHSVKEYFTVASADDVMLIERCVSNKYWEKTCHLVSLFSSYHLFVLSLCSVGRNEKIPDSY